MEAKANDPDGVPILLDSTVTVRGIVTVGREYGNPAVIQDATGAIAVYDAAFSDSAVIGDDVTITGRIAHYNGLTELTDVRIAERHGSGNIVLPRVVTISELLADGANGVERFEAMLVRITRVTVNTSRWNVSGPGSNYILRDGGNQIAVRIDSDVGFAGAPAPLGSFDIVAVVGQYKTARPYIGGYQLMPRSAGDILVSGPKIVSLPIETAIEAEEVTLEWATASEAAAFVRYGDVEGLEKGIVPGEEGSKRQSVTIRSLAPATIYRVQPFSVAAGDTSFARTFHIITAAAASTGEMNVYFNQPVARLHPPLPARGSELLEQRLLTRLDGAAHSIDACLYSLSGAVGGRVAAAILRARQRGVRIRMIFERDNAGSDAIQSLRTSVPAILDDFDSTNAGAGLMHNKFFIIDARDRRSDRDDWLMTGSWNPTDPGTADDAQNLVEIQDQSLAAIYTREFEEMWGSGTDTPDARASRFGARKEDNTPHRVRTGGAFIDVRFSPSDGTNEYLLQSIADARRSVFGSIFTFTREDLGTAMIRAKENGRAVRLVLDNASDRESQYDRLLASGIDVHLKGNLRGYLHHKYLLIDADAPPGTTPPLCITGSHNWTNSAEQANNENTLGFRQWDIAVQFLQEWYQRYTDAGGRAIVQLAIDRAGNRESSFDAGSAYPNPVPLSRDGRVLIPVRFGTGHRPLEIALSDHMGRIITRMTGITVQGDMVNVFLPFPPSAPGVYLIRITDGRQSIFRRVVAVR